MVKKILFISLVLPLFAGCLNIFRDEVEYDSNAVAAESVKAEIDYIEISVDKTIITLTQSAIFKAKVYNKFDIYFNNTEVSFYVQGEKEHTTYTGEYEFKPEDKGDYDIYVKKGNVTSSSIEISVE